MHEGYKFTGLIDAWELSKIPEGKHPSQPTFQGLVKWATFLHATKWNKEKANLQMHEAWRSTSTQTRAAEQKMKESSKTCQSCHP